MKQPIYLILFVGGRIILEKPIPSKKTVMTLLGAPGLNLSFQVDSKGNVHVMFPLNIPFSSLVGKGAWTIKMTYVTAN